MSCANTSDGFDVGGDTLFDPMVLVVYGGKSQMNHFVGQHPVRGKLRQRSLIANAYGDSSAAIAECHTVTDASSLERNDLNQESRHWKAAIVLSDGLSGGANPSMKVLRRHLQRVSFDPDVDPRGRDQRTRSHLTLRCHKRETREKQERRQGSPGKEASHMGSKHRMTMRTILLEKQAIRPELNSLASPARNQRNM
jgi:hypothetical protein